MTPFRVVYDSIKYTHSWTMRSGSLCVHYGN